MPGERFAHAQGERRGTRSAITELRFTARDDRFHFAELGDDWWATGTAWFSFHHPERRLGGWLYTIVRPNIGTVAGGTWVWDHTAYLPWEVLYSANYSVLQLPRDQDLDDAGSPPGLRSRCSIPVGATRSSMTTATVCGSICASTR